MKDLKEKLETVYHGLSKREEIELCHDWISYDEAHGKSTLVFTEELAELISAVSKYDGRPEQRDYERWLHIAEEMADVQIVLTMMKEKYQISEDLLAKIRLLKLSQPIPEESPSGEKETDAQIIREDETHQKTGCQDSQIDADEDWHENAMPLTSLVDRFILRLNEFETAVDAMIDATASSLSTFNGGENPMFVYTNIDWANKSTEDREFVITKLLTKCEKIIKNGRLIRNIARTAEISEMLPPNYVYVEEQIVNTITSIIYKLKGSNLDPYFWSFSKNELTHLISGFWPNGIELLHTWRKCVSASKNSICETPMPNRKRGGAVSGK